MTRVRKGRARTGVHHHGRRLTLEPLEDRCLLTTYRPTDLGNLSTHSPPDDTLVSAATGINGTGTVVGYSETDDIITLMHTNPHNIHAFTYDQTGGLTNLGTIIAGLLNQDPTTTASKAFAINSSGQVVGSIGVMNEKPINGGLQWVSVYEAKQAFFYDPQRGMVILLNSFDPVDYPVTEAYAINDSGEVVGRAQIRLSQQCSSGSQSFMVNFRAVIWNPPGQAPTPIPPLDTGYESHAYAVDPLGNVFGDSSDGSNPTGNICAPPRAFSWAPNATSSMGLNQFFSSSNESRVYGANAAGLMVGFYGTHDPGNAFIMRSSDYGWSQLQTPETSDYYDVAYAISDRGVVVGAVWSAPGLSPDEGFVWVPYTDNSIDGPSPVTDLNTQLPSGSGWHIQSANAINHSGWIAGQGLNPLGHAHAVVLIPSLSLDASGRRYFPPLVDPVAIPALASRAPSAGMEGAAAAGVVGASSPVAAEWTNTLTLLALAWDSPLRQQAQPQAGAVPPAILTARRASEPVFTDLLDDSPSWNRIE